MALVIRSEPALQDYLEIWDYIARDNAGAADRLLEMIDTKLQLYAENPRMGTARDRLSAGLRSFPAGNYLVFYRIVPGGIELARVLHGARNLSTLFEG
jgi:toxin ParE1/3/4